MTTATMTATPSRSRSRVRINGSAVVMTVYLLFLLLPIYWLVNMSLKTNTEILKVFSLWPRNLTFANYHLTSYFVFLPKAPESAYCLVILLIRPCWKKYRMIAVLPVQTH